MSNAAYHTRRDGGNHTNESRGPRACDALRDLQERLRQSELGVIMPGEKKLMITQINLKGSDKRLRYLEKAIMPDPQLWGVIAIQDVPTQVAWPAMGLRRSHHVWYNSRVQLTEDDHPMHRDPESSPPELAKRVCFLVPRSIPTMDWWVEAPDWAGDMLATLHLRTPSGDIQIHNVYRNTNQPETPLNMDTLIRECSSSNSVLLGDFNLHHELWAGSEVTPCKESKKLANAVRSHNLHLCNTPGVITYTRSAHPDGPFQSTIDLTFLGEFLTPRFLHWSVTDVEGFDSDHRVIRTTLDCPPNRQISIRRRWRETSVEDFRTSVQKNLLALPPQDLDSTEGIDIRLWAIVKIIEDAIKDHVPSDDILEPSRSHVPASVKKQKAYKEVVSSTTAGNPRSTQRWAKQARRRAQPTQSPFTPDFNYKGKTAKTAYEKADMYMDAIYGEGNTSREHSVNPELPQNIDCSLPQGHQLGRMVPGQDQSPGEVLKSIESLPDRKATGVDIIGNEALKMLGDIVTPYFEDVFAACLSKGHYPKWLKFSRTILFLKPGKSDDRPTSYRPIALLTSVGKVLEKVIIGRLKRALDALPESCRLPLGQFGGLPGKSTTAALHSLTNFIFTGWIKGQKVSGLSLDISGAFPHADRIILMRILVEKGIPGYIIRIIWSWLCDRQTVLEIPGQEEQLFFENGGLPQGSCLSPFLFLIFAAPLFDVKKLMGKAFFDIFAFVDDTYITVRSCSFEINCEVLEWVHAQILKWSNGSGVTFDPGKYGLLHFLSNRDRGLKVTVRPSIDDLPPDEVLFSKRYLVILGVRVDDCLSWKYHIEHMIARVSKNMRCLKEISGANWGPDLQRMRMLYVSQIQSIFSYASPAWFFAGIQAHRQQALSSKLVKDLDKLQGQCLTELSGAMRTTSIDILRKELCIPKLSIYLRMKTVAYFAKKLESPNYKDFQGERTKALAKTKRQLYSHPFEKLEIQAKELINSAKARLEHHHGPEVMKGRWNEDHKRVGAIDRMTMLTVHAQCSSEWQQCRDGWRSTHTWPRPLALAEPWGPQSMRYHDGLTREESTMLLHCRTGHIGLAAYLHRFGLHPTDRCPFCRKGPHTVEHLFIHCDGKECSGRDMAWRRARLFELTEGVTDLRTIFTEHPDEAARFAIKTFGIPQFTRASWKIKEARPGKRGRPEPVQDEAAGPARKRKKYSLLDLGRRNYRQAPKASSQQAR